MMEEEVDKSLHIKGQMNFMPDWNVVMFLCSPAIANLEQLQVFSIDVAGMITIAIMIAIAVVILITMVIMIAIANLDQVHRRLPDSSSAISPCTTSQGTSSLLPGLRRVWVEKLILCLCSQQSNELKDALESENVKTKQMEERKNIHNPGEYFLSSRKVWQSWMWR